MSTNKWGTSRQGACPLASVTHHYDSGPQFPSCRPFGRWIAHCAVLLKSNSILQLLSLDYP